MRRGILGLTALFLAAIATPPRAQGWPERAVTLVVPFAPGGAAGLAMSALTQPPWRCTIACPTTRASTSPRLR